MAKPGGAAPSRAFGAPKSDESFEIDLTDVQSGFQIKPGQYPGKVIDVIMKQNKEKTANMYEWTFAITGKDYPGKQFKMWTSHKPEALWKLAETLEAMGLQGSGGVNKFAKSDVMNCPVMLVIIDDTYKDKPVSRLDSVKKNEAALNLFHSAKNRKATTIDSAVPAGADKATETPTGKGEPATEAESTAAAQEADEPLTAAKWDEMAQSMAVDDGMTLEQIEAAIGYRPEEAPFN